MILWRTDLTYMRPHSLKPFLYSGSRARMFQRLGFDSRSYFMFWSKGEDVGGVDWGRVPSWMGDVWLVRIWVCGWEEKIDVWGCDWPSGLLTNVPYFCWKEGFTLPKDGDVINWIGACGWFEPNDGVREPVPIVLPPAIFCCPNIPWAGWPTCWKPVEAWGWTLPNAEVAVDAVPNPPLSPVPKLVCLTKPGAVNALIPLRFRGWLKELLFWN